MAGLLLRAAAAAVACLGSLAQLAAAGSDASSARSASLPSFEEYLQEHGLKYWGGEHEERKGIYEAALRKIKAQNEKKDALWKAGVNRLTVMKPEERETLFGYMKQTAAKPAFGYTPAARGSLPASKDWREHRPAVVTAVKNQGSCGSCWAFAATAVMETAIALATDTLFDLSPQQLTSCTPNPQECGGSGGCAGATAQLAFNYTVQAGLTSVWNWPYTSGIWKNNGECHDMVGKKRAVAGITGYVQLPQNDARALMEAVLVNPVSVSVAATFWFWYSSGIFDFGDKARPIVNHAVILMGYGEEEGVHYWLIRNSWGPTWGEQGYIRLRRFPDGEPCGVDDEPLSGYSCKSNPPDSIRACGTNGILSDSSYPIGAFLGAPQDPDDPALDSAALPRSKGVHSKAAEEAVVSDAEALAAGKRGRLRAVPRASAAAVAAALAAGVAALAVAVAVPAVWRRGARAARYAEVKHVP